MLAAYVGEYSIMQVLTWAGNPADETPLDLLDKFGWTLPSKSLRSVYEMTRRPAIRSWVPLGR